MAPVTQLLPDWKKVGVALGNITSDIALILYVAASDS